MAENRRKRSFLDKAYARLNYWKGVLRPFLLLKTSANMKHLLLLTLLVNTSVFTWAQATVSGKVFDATTNEALPGAVINASEGNGVATDLDGTYSIKLAKGTYTLRASYVGMEPMEINVVIAGENQTIDFALQSGATMTEVNVIADMAVGRRTPVAFSDISSIKIKEELASRDLPMILNTTPGVYATQSGGVMVMRV